MARNVPRVKVDPPKMNEYLGLRNSTITRVYTVCVVIVHFPTACHYVAVSNQWLLDTQGVVI